MFNLFKKVQVEANIKKPSVFMEMLRTIEKLEGEAFVKKYQSETNIPGFKSCEVCGGLFRKDKMKVVIDMYSHGGEISHDCLFYCKEHAPEYDATHRLGGVRTYVKEIEVAVVDNKIVHWFLGNK